MVASHFGAMRPAALFGRIAFAAVIMSFFFCVPPLHAACLFGVGNCNDGIIGTYLLPDNPNATLKIDSANISASEGPLTISAAYIVKSKEGNQILIEVSAPGEPKGEALLIVDGDTLHIKNNFAFNGNWKRK